MFLLGFLNLFFGITFQATAQTKPPNAEIISVNLKGSGCDLASAAVSISPDLQDLSILFDNMVLEAKPSMVNPKNLIAAKQCTVNIEMGVPAGWQFALVSVDYRGFASVPKGATAFQRFVYNAPMMPIVSLREARFVGPYTGNFIFQANQKATRLAWTPCSQSKVSLAMTASVGIAYSLRNRYPEAMVSLDSQDLSFKQTFQVQWQQCSRN